MSYVCLVWYVVCRGRMYVVGCLVGVSSLRFLLYKEVGSRWKSQRSLFARLSASAGRCTSSPPIITQAFPVTVNICCWYCNNNNQHGLTWTAFNIPPSDILPIDNNTTNYSKCRPSLRWTRTCATCVCPDTPHRQPTRREHG